MLVFLWVVWFSFGLCTSNGEEEDEVGNLHAEMRFQANADEPFQYKYS